MEAKWFISDPLQSSLKEGWAKCQSVFQFGLREYILHNFSERELTKVTFTVHVRYMSSCVRLSVYSLSSIM